jgi:hypothetical protein
MKQKEFAEQPHSLTWDNVLAFLREAAPHGCATREFEERFGATYQQTRGLLQVMFDAGAVARVQTGKTAGLVLYFDRG